MHAKGEMVSADTENVHIVVQLFITQSQDFSIPDFYQSLSKNRLQSRVKLLQDVLEKHWKSINNAIFYFA